MQLIVQIPEMRRHFDLDEDREELITVEKELELKNPIDDFDKAKEVIEKNCKERRIGVEYWQEVFEKYPHIAYASVCSELQFPTLIKILDKCSDFCAIVSFFLLFLLILWCLYSAFDYLFHFSNSV